MAAKKSKPKGAKKRGRPTARSKKSRFNYQLMGGVAVVAVAALWLFYPTYQMRIEQQKQLEAVKRQYVQLRVENQALKERLKQTRQPEYIERYAREKLGLVKPGENAYVVLPPSRSRPATQSATRAKKPAASTEPTGTWETVKKFLAGLFAR